MIQALSQPFQSVQDRHQPFLALWPHRFDYLWAEHPAPGQKPNWKTERRHPLSDRLIQQGSFLYGVRFGPKTDYCLLDIDAGSYYHPARDPFAIFRMHEALEPLGLVTSIACTSSYSGGLHLYFPFSEAYKTGTIARAVTTLLENAGFKVAPGQLEVYPNARHYSLENHQSLFAGHRLPLQAGSYLLNQDWQPIWSSQDMFVSQWQLAQHKNDINTRTLKQITKQSQRQRYKVSNKANKFINDLNAEIEVGWTGSGQTNRLLGRIALRSYVFGHVLYASKQLEGQDLIEDIIRVAQSLPGFDEYCHHQQDLAQRAAEWAHCVEKSRYYHYGRSKIQLQSPKTEEQREVPEPPETPDMPAELTHNQRQALGARQRIERAVEEMLQNGTLPTNISDRLHAIQKYHVSPSTLYKYKDLWCPGFWTPPNPPTTKGSSEPTQRSGSEESPNLFKGFGYKPLPRNNSSDSEKSPGDSLSKEGCNPLLDIVSSLQETVPGPKTVAQILLEVKARRQAEAELAKIRRSEAEPTQIPKPSASQINRMRQYLESGDRILIAEVQQWLQAYPGALDPDQPSSP